MVNPPEIEGGDGTPVPPLGPQEAPENGQAALPSLTPTLPVSAGTVVPTETPVAGMSIEGLASILGPMLAQQSQPVMAPTETAPSYALSAYNGAINEQYAKDVMMQSLMSFAGMESDTTPRPEYFEMTVRAREAALEKAVRGVSKTDEDDSDKDEERGLGASAELPAGIPMWPPKVFLARERTYTLPWHREILGQGRVTLKEGDPRIVDGETLSNIMIWLDFARLTQILLQAALATSNWAVVPSLVQQTCEYTQAAYSAGRARTDGITMSLLNKDAAALYARNRTMSLGTTNLDRRPAEFIQTLNKQTQLAAAKVIANKIANAKPDSQSTGDGGGDSPAQTSRAKKRAARLEKLQKAKDDAAAAEKLKTLNSKTNTTTTPAGGPQPTATDSAKKNGGTGASKGK